MITGEVFWFGFLVGVLLVLIGLFVWSVIGWMAEDAAERKVREHMRKVRRILKKRNEQER